MIFSLIGGPSSQEASQICLNLDLIVVVPARRAAHVLKILCWLICIVLISN